MKRGYELRIQSNLKPKEKEIAKEFLNDFIKRVRENNGSWIFWSRGGQGARCFLKRGIFGRLVTLNDKSPNGLVFRRISRNRRVFAVVKANRLVGKDAPIEYYNCICGIHLGGTRVNMLPTETNLYYTEGEVKG